MKRPTGRASENEICGDLLSWIQISSNTCLNHLLIVLQFLYYIIAPDNVAEEFDKVCRCVGTPVPVRVDVFGLKHDDRWPFREGDLGPSCNRSGFRCSYDVLDLTRVAKVGPIPHPTQTIYRSFLGL